MTRSAFLFLGLALCCGALAVTSGCSREAPHVEATPLPTDEALRDRIDRALEFTQSGRHLNTKDQAAWQIVHGALAYGRDYQVYNTEGQLVPALDYLLQGGSLRGWTLRKGDHGLEAVLEAGSKTGQGHEDQWLGYLSQCGLSPDDDIVVDGQSYKVRDLITQAQWDIYDGMEATWTLMAFSTYLPPDAEWTAKDGSKWNIPRIVEMEAAQNLDDSACGGTHRMYGLTVARNVHRQQGGAATPGDAWDKAQQKIDDAVATARKFQQPDGSFSTNYFSRPATSPDIAARIGTTGHTLEFLTVALDDEQLKQPWVTRAAVSLLECLERTQKFDLECGALYHAAHGLELYRTRRFGPRKPNVAAEPAVVEPASSESKSAEPPQPAAAEAAAVAPDKPAATEAAAAATP
ncbi:MAG: ADP-ribosylation factor-directed GTPase activating protein isoform b [Pirellulales bacterium]